MAFSRPPGLRGAEGEQVGLGASPWPSVHQPRVGEGTMGGSGRGGEDPGRWWLTCSFCICEASSLSTCFKFVF